jgi:molybdenum cofactor cytidylyltransferase
MARAPERPFATRKMPSIAAIVLAAGGSERMGRPKPLLRFRGESLLARTVRAARDGGCAAVWVVTRGEPAAGGNAAGPTGDSAAIIEEARAERAIVVASPEWWQGISASIRAGLAAVEGDPSVDGVLFLAADQPFVEAEDIARLISASESGAPIAAADYGNGAVGIPALFRRPYFPALERLEGDSGAKSVLQSERDSVRLVTVPSAAIDVDSPDDCRRWGIE